MKKFGKFRYINTKFWTDKYIEVLELDEKLLFLYFLTSPLTNISGIYEITMRQISFHTGINVAEVSKILQKFEKDSKIYYLLDEGWVYIKNFQKHQAINDSIVKGIEYALEQLSEDVLKGFEAKDKDFSAFIKNPGKQLKKFQDLKDSKKIKSM